MRNLVEKLVIYISVHVSYKYVPVLDLGTAMN